MLLVFGLYRAQKNSAFFVHEKEQEPKKSLEHIQKLSKIRHWTSDLDYWVCTQWEDNSTLKW